MRKELTYTFIIEESTSTSTMVSLPGFNAKMYTINHPQTSELFRVEISGILLTEVKRIVGEGKELPVQPSFTPGIRRTGQVTIPFALLDDGYIITEPPDTTSSYFLISHIAEEIRFLMKANYGKNMRLLSDNLDNTNAGTFDSIVTLINSDINRDFGSEELAYISKYMPIIHTRTKAIEDLDDPYEFLKVNVVSYYSQYEIVIALGPFMYGLEYPYVLIFGEKTEGLAGFIDYINTVI